LFEVGLALWTSSSVGVSLGADADLSRGVRLAKKGEEGEVECWEKVVMGESMPSGFGDEDFQPNREENLEVGECFLLVGDADCVEPIELFEVDLGRPAGLESAMLGTLYAGTGVGDRLLDLVEVDEVTDATRTDGDLPPRFSTTPTLTFSTALNGGGVLSSLCSRSC